MKPTRLRGKVALAFGSLSLAVAVLVALLTYQLVVSYLTGQREQAAVNRTLLDADAVVQQAEASSTPAAQLAALTTIGTTQRLLRVGDNWYATGVSVSPDDLPRSLLEQVATTGAAKQRFAIGDTVYFAVAVEADGGTFVEVFPLTELVRTIDLLRISLLVGSLLAAALGAVVGWFAARQLLMPLRRLTVTAGAFGRGDFDQRMGVTGDGDLDAIAIAFDDMADAVQERIARERRFVANVSHELRTPVTVALGTVEILDGRRDDFPPSSAQLLTVLTQQVTRLAHMVMDLIELGTLIPGSKPRWDHVDIADIAAEVLRDRDINSALLIHSGDTEVVTDPARVERILANLVDNAELHGAGLTGLGVSRQEACVIVTVEDEGVGIPEAERGRVFELFSRGKAADPGTGSGLGLTLVAEQCELIGASITVEESEGGGARFVLQVPVNTPPQPGAEGADRR